MVTWRLPPSDVGSETRKEIAADVELVRSSQRPDTAEAVSEIPVQAEW